MYEKLRPFSEIVKRPENREIHVRNLVNSISEHTECDLEQALLKKSAEDLIYLVIWHVLTTDDCNFEKRDFKAVEDYVRFGELRGIELLKRRAPDFKIQVTPHEMMFQRMEWDNRLDSLLTEKADRYQRMTFEDLTAFSAICNHAEKMINSFRKAKPFYN